MAKITTQVLTTVTVGDGVDNLQATKTTLDVGSKAFTVSVIITAKPTVNGSRVTVFVVSSPVNVTAAQAVTQLSRHAYAKEFSWPLDSGRPTHVQTPPRIVQGDYVYVWFELPTVASPGTMDAWVTEI